MASTLFIDNLPRNFSSNDLRRLFTIQGPIADAYVPHIQKKRVYGRFGFVEVLSRQQGDRLINETNGKLVGRQAIRAQWARYPKRSRRTFRPPRGDSEQTWKWGRDRGMNQVLNRGLWRPKQKAAVTRLSDEFVQRNKTAKVIQLDKANDNQEWMERSLTCFSDFPSDIAVLRAEIQKAFPYQVLVRDLGKFKFLLTLESKEMKEKLRSEGEGCLKQWFSSISEWAEDDACQSRRLWLEIVGIPIHVWSEHNIKKIAENWGDVVYIDKDTSLNESFASAKVIIDSLCLNPIEDEALLQVEDKGFRISVFEAKTEYTIIHMGSLDEDVSSQSMRIICQQKVDERGSKGEVANHDDVGTLERLVMLNHEAEHDVRDDEQGHDDRCGLNSNLILDPLDGRPRVSLNGCFNLHSVGNASTAPSKGIECGSIMKHGQQEFEAAVLAGEEDCEGLKGKGPEGGGNGIIIVSSNSCSRTKVAKANFSIGSGEDIISQNIDEMHMIQSEELMDRCVSLSASSRTKTRTAQLNGMGYSEEVELLHQRGAFPVEEEVSQYHASEGNSLDMPPGFYAKPCQVGLDNEQPQVQEAKRVTRSQTKQCKGSVLGRNGIKNKCTAGEARQEGSHSRSDSAKTTDSMLKIANEAIEMGEMLGLRLISKKEKAVKRITRSLKSKRT